MFHFFNFFSYLSNQPEVFKSLDNPSTMLRINMRLNFIPKTGLGKLSVVFTVPVLLAGMCGVFAFFTGVIGIIKRKEWAVFVFLATTMGLFVLGFCLGEILFPH